MGKLTDQEKIDIVEKKIKNSTNLNASIGTFLKNVLIKLPLFVFVLLPILILNLIWQKLSAFINKQRGIRTKRIKRPEPIIVESSKVKSKADRKYDIVVFGATGYTGQFVCEFLAQQTEENITWAIAGRSKSKLEEVKNSITKINPQLTDLPILIAESSDRSQLEEIANNTRVVVTTAGPFDRHGSLLVALCVAYGTDYCDITGEISWVREMIQLFDEQAVKTGARILNGVGLDSLPWDLVTYKLAQKLKSSGEKLEKVEFFDDIPLTPSGGTLNTLVNSLSGPKSDTKRPDFDPLLKVLGKNEKSENKQKTKNQSFIGKQRGKWIGAWFLADGNSCVIKRSNTLLQYSPSLFYIEKKVFHNFFDAFNDTFSAYFMGLILFNTWIKDLAFGTLLPAPGTGLDATERSKNYAKIVGEAKGDKGTKLKAEIYFTEDPGYQDTGRMVAQVGLSLLKDKPLSQGGFHTAASALGDNIITRLSQYGTAFRYV